MLAERDRFSFQLAGQPAEIAKNNRPSTALRAAPESAGHCRSPAQSCGRVPRCVFPALRQRAATRGRGRAARPCSRPGRPWRRPRRHSHPQYRRAAPRRWDSALQGFPRSEACRTCCRPKRRRSASADGAAQPWLRARQQREEASVRLRPSVCSPSLHQSKGKWCSLSGWQEIDVCAWIQR